MDFAALAYPFTLGSVAAFNPCGIAMLPAFVSYFLATEDGSLADVGAGLVARVVRALSVGLALTAGFLILFTVAGGVISAVREQRIRWYASADGVRVKPALSGPRPVSL